jgi:HEAT repeat protein
MELNMRRPILMLALLASALHGADPENDPIWMEHSRSEWLVKLEAQDWRENVAAAKIFALHPEASEIAKPKLKRCLQHEEVELRYHAARALLYMKDAEGIGAMYTLSKGGNQSVATAAEAELENPAQQSIADFLAADSIDSLKSKTATRDRKLQAVHLLKSGHFTKTVTPDAVASLEIALERDELFEAVDALSELAEAERAMQALFRMGFDLTRGENAREQSMKMLARFCGFMEVTRRKNKQWIPPEWFRKEVPRMIKALSDDPTVKVRLNLMDVLVHAEPDNKDLVEALQACAKSENESVRTKAKYAIEYLDNKKNKP